MNAVTRLPTTAAPRPVLVPQTFDQLVTFAEMAAQSDLMPRDYKGKPANIMLAIQMGSELGLAPMQSIQSIAVINGRPGVWGDGMIGLCRQSPLCEDIQESIAGEGDAMVATCIAKRRGSSPVTSRFSVADAKKAGLWGKQGPWQQYPARMLQNRARGFALRDAFPDLLRGLKTVEELRDTPVDDFRGTTLNAQPEHARSTPAPSRPRDAVDADSIPSLDPPAPDKQANATTRLVARIEACATEDNLHAISGDQAIQTWRTKLAKARPELDTRIADAFGARYDALIAARPDVSDEVLPAVEPAAADDEFGSAFT